MDRNKAKEFIRRYSAWFEETVDELERVYTLDSDQAYEEAIKIMKKNHLYGNKFKTSEEMDLLALWFAQLAQKTTWRVTTTFYNSGRVTAAFYRAGDEPGDFGNCDVYVDSFKTKLEALYFIDDAKNA